MALPLTDCIFLAGAPYSEDLDWAESSLLSPADASRRSVARHAHVGPQEATPTWCPPTWRSVAVELLKGAKSNIDDNATPKTQFLSSGARIPDLDVHRHDFFDHSMALLDGLVSSQIAPPGHYDESTLFTLNTASFTSTISDLTSFAESIASPRRLEPTIVSADMPLMDLKSIPPASHILQVAPQTITINSICGIISIAPIRNVQLRRNNSTMDILELLVGDETRAGFSISFWLVPQESQRKPADDLRDALSTLRPGDTILLTSIALSAFRGSVYGQSLSERFSRNSTTVTKLVSTQDSTLEHALAAKLHRVRRWTSDFVGEQRRPGPPATIVSDDDCGQRGLVEQLPPDTPV